MSDKTITVTDENFDTVVKENPLLILDCWAPWCGPCKMIAPIIEELAQAYAGKASFGKLNTDDNQATAMKLNIMAIPTLLFIKNGELVDKIVGVVPKENIESVLSKYVT